MVWVKWISKDKIREVKEKVMAKRHGLVQRRKASAESGISANDTWEERK